LSNLKNLTYKQLLRDPLWNPKEIMEVLSDADTIAGVCEKISLKIAISTEITEAIANGNLVVDDYIVVDDFYGVVDVIAKSFIIINESGEKTVPVFKSCNVIKWAISENLDIPEPILDWYKSQQGIELTQKPLSWQKERTLNNTIAVLLEVINEKQLFSTQAELVNHITDNYQGFYGIGKTNLDTNFAAAKRELDEERKRLQVK
jgi:hypothetical protein